MSGSKTMRAIVQDAFGGPDVLREAETERPSPRPGEVLIRVRTAGVNPTDWKHRAGGGFLGEPPFVLGWDVCGTVTEVGYGVTIHRTGDEVFGMLPYPFGHGAHAEYVTGPARAFVARPEGMDAVQAGALPLVSLTAWQALVDTAVLGPGQRLLVHAAAGGVGHVAVQVAKSRGAYVVGTASAAKHGFLRSLGADEQLDYRETDFAEAVSGMDVVLEPFGGEHALRSLRVLRPGGTLVSLLPLPEELYAEAGRLGVRAAVMLVQHDQAGMRAVADLAATDRLRATVARTFPLAEAARAHAEGETGRTTGKLVLTVG
jgi:NADPH:quinone reductase-like Zn-dependent oxidoreductase